MDQVNFQSCIDACNVCANACDSCSAACLREDDVKAMARCIGLDMDCAQICRLAASFMARGSAQDQALCRICADICKVCADECGQHQMDHCQKCAEACRACAVECRRMAAGA